VNATKTRHTSHADHHLRLAHQARAWAAESIQDGRFLLVDSFLNSAVRQYELAGNTGPEYKAAVGDLALWRFHG
jgi:hypothetical protein